MALLLCKEHKELVCADGTQHVPESMALQQRFRLAKQVCLICCAERGGHHNESERLGQVCVAQTLDVEREHRQNEQQHQQLIRNFQVGKEDGERAHGGKQQQRDETGTRQTHVTTQRQLHRQHQIAVHAKEIKILHCLFADQNTAQRDQLSTPT
jgi:hypothetical protein